MATIKLIKEKAKAYDEALKVLHKYDGAHIMFTQDLKEEMFPELREEYEDEKTRKELLAIINDLVLPDEQQSRFIAWLEKQGEHANFRNKIQIGDKVTRNEDGVLVNLSQLKRIAKPAENKSKHNMGISETTKKKLEDNLNKALEKETPESCNEFLEKQGEQEHVIAPKFDIGDTIMNKITNEVFTITDRCISLEYYHDINHLHEIKFSEQDNWELIEQKSAWSEEDEKILNLIIARLHSHPNVEVEEYGKDYHWLKSLKERYTWKPSDEQLKSLKEVINVGYFTSYPNSIETLYEQLKKLREEQL